MVPQSRGSSQGNLNLCLSRDARYIVDPDAIETTRSSSYRRILSVCKNKLSTRTNNKNTIDIIVQHPDASDCPSALTR